MTDTQFAVIVAVIWIAPHSDKWHALAAGCSFVLIAALRGLGLI